MTRTGIACAAFLWVLAAHAAFAQETTSTAGSAAQTTATTTGQVGTTVTLPSGLKYIDLLIGDGPVAKTGDTVAVHYVGTLTSGTKFDASREWLVPVPLKFELGSGKVIKGWDQGVPGMRVGGKRLLVIPPELGYGDAGAGSDIPPKATLIFEVELVALPEPEKK